MTEKRQELDFKCEFILKLHGGRTILKKKKIKKRSELAVDNGTI